MPKACPNCKEKKPLSGFYKSKSYEGKTKDGRSCWCIECLRERQRSGAGRNSRLKYRYNINLDEYNQMFAKQKGCCKICGRHSSEFRVNIGVDHDHTTGKVRGLLCFKCNQMIGHADDSPDRLRQAVIYLEN